MLFSDTCLVITDWNPFNDGVISARLVVISVSAALGSTVVKETRLVAQ